MTVRKTRARPAVPAEAQGRAAHLAEGATQTFGPQDVLRRLRVGAMNIEHREILAVVDKKAWMSLSNGGRQAVTSMLRASWASRVCPQELDIAYLTVQTDDGEVVARAGPHSLFLKDS
jgi:hypothetical protein